MNILNNITSFAEPLPKPQPKPEVPLKGEIPEPKELTDGQAIKLKNESNQGKIDAYKAGAGVQEEPDTAKNYTDFSKNVRKSENLETIIESTTQQNISAAKSSDLTQDALQQFQNLQSQVKKDAGLKAYGEI